MVEHHPLKPFLPKHCTLLMLGSFPPPTQRWCMDFFYPNYNNDMWRIMGQVFYADSNKFVDLERKTFLLESIIPFLEEHGIALYDTATSVERTQGTAADSNLRIVEPTDIRSLLDRLPQCKAIITTGQLATQLLQKSLSLPTAPTLQQPVDCHIGQRTIRCHRLPSSSRRLMGTIQHKAQAYETILKQYYT